MVRPSFYICLIIFILCAAMGFAQSLDFGPIGVFAEPRSSSVSSFNPLLGSMNAPQSNFGLKYLQSSGPENNSAGEPSQFVRDLRRFEIVSIGTFPFTLLFINIGFEVGRYISTGAQSGFDSEQATLYQPVIFGERILTNDEKLALLLSAAGTSLLLGVIDLIIEKNK